ncbi:MAG: substrate-binding domain-containing protein [Kiritimatiellae bacterium]|nr:substrate-binding domain-containing protein [Kiritimatiellia bacterium]
MIAHGTILCLDFHVNEEKYRRELAGIERFAKHHGFKITMLERFIPEELPEILARLRPSGCIAECSRRFDIRTLPPRLFGNTPAVYLDPTQRLPWKGVASVVCDNATVARMAFRELSSGLPSACAVVGYRYPCQWSRERVATFRACCREAGLTCLAFPDGSGETQDEREARLAEWGAALPPHCAVFAVNDFTADETWRAFQKAGRILPRTAVLVGVDAVPADLAAEMHFSTIRLDFEHAGYLAARLLAASSSVSRPRGGRETVGPLLVERRASTRGRGRREAYIVEAVETIRREACDGLTAAALAARFRGSRHLFEMRFREAMGHSVLDEILHVRLERVLELLSNSEVPIGAIASFSGFRTDGELRKLFLSRFHVSMREWRRTRR